MNDSGKRKTENEQRREGDQALEDRKAEATSDETLSDLEETESDSISTDTSSDPGPSPDGMLDESDEIKDAGPM